MNRMHRTCSFEEVQDEPDAQGRAALRRYRMNRMHRDVQL